MVRPAGIRQLIKFFGRVQKEPREIMIAMIIYVVKRVFRHICPI